ncbi:MAG: Ig-like domain-containing protein, partial [Alphaproteobacteria bacterium]|nr:Ig-like domain-containing protein [Alphaproteobacteria bacterium]
MRWAAILAIAACMAVATAPSTAVAQSDDAVDLRAYDKAYGLLVFDAGFAFVEHKYFRPVSMREFGIAGIRGLSSVDRNLTFEEDDDVLQLIYLGNLVAETEIPDGNGPGDWARYVVDVIELLRSGVRRFGEADAEELFEAIFDGATATLDSATRYNSASEAAEARANRQGFGGVGLVLDVGFRTAAVAEISIGSPAERAGIRIGDLLTHIDGITINGRSNDQLRDALRGPIDSSVELTMRRPGEEADILSIVRKRIVPSTVTALFDRGIAEIKIERFNRGTAETVENVIEEFQAASDEALRGVIIDLRFNPGGLLIQAAKVANLFLTDGPLSRSVGRVPEAESNFSADGIDMIDGRPIVVLINSRSASASEVLAAALQDRGRAVIVGSSSFGKGSVQSIYPLPNAGDIVMTWSLLRAPSGYFYDRLGVLPNICTSGRGGVEVAGGFSLVSPDPDEVLADIRAEEPAAFRSLLETWRSIDRDTVEDEIVRLRRSCSPARGDHFLDLEIARRILADRGLYLAALSRSSTRPVAADDMLIASERGLIGDGATADLTNLLDNDHDLDGDPIRVVSVNGSPALLGQTIDLASGATIKITADGAIDFNADNISRELAEGEIRTERITYAIADDDGVEAEATLVVSIEGRNDEPQAGSDTGAVDEDSVLEAASADGLLANDADPENDPLTVVAVNGDDELVGQAFTLPSGAQLTVQADGSYRFDPAGAFDHLADGRLEFTGFNYEVADDQDARATGTVMIEIAGRNDRPLAVADEILVGEDTPQEFTATFGVLSNDTDPDGDHLTIVAVNGEADAVGAQVTLGRGLAVILSDDGSLAIDPQDKFNELALSETVIETLNYTVRDAGGEEAGATVTFVIEGLNDNPVAADDAAETDQHLVLEITKERLLANDQDIDGDILSLIAINDAAVTPGAVFETELGAAVTVGEDGGLRYDPRDSEELAALTPGSIVEDRFSYTVSDALGATGGAHVNITVVARPPATVARGNHFDLSASAVLRVSAEFGLLADDPGQTGALAEVSEIAGSEDNIGRVVETQAGALLTIGRDGTVVYDPNGAFDDLAESQRATEEISYAVIDAHGVRTVGQVVFEITGAG